MKLFTQLALVATLATFQLSATAQGVIGGNQDGFGPGGYLPKPLISSPPTAAGQIVSSLAMPGYAFKLVEISGQPVKLIVDSSTGIVPLANTANPVLKTNALGFLATFTLDNKTGVNRMFDFPADYYANIRVGFRVLDSDDNVVWQSYQLLVDIPPLTPPTTLTLARRSFWKNQVFVPIYNLNTTVIGPGNYTLEAEILGSPAYSSRVPFTVSVLVGGPIIPPTPLVK